MMEITQIDEINRIVYWWIRYEGIHCPKGKKFSKKDIAILIERLEIYNKHPEKFDWDKGGVPKEE